jgi:hypothetical protein
MATFGRPGQYRLPDGNGDICCFHDRHKPFPPAAAWLAELATGTTRQATQVQQLMGGPLSESDFMPDIEELPEGIMELEFKQRYHDLDSRE